MEPLSVALDYVSKVDRIGDLTARGLSNFEEDEQSAAHKKLIEALAGIDIVELFKTIDRYFTHLWRGFTQTNYQLKKIETTKETAHTSMIIGSSLFTPFVRYARRLRDPTSGEDRLEFKTLALPLITQSVFDAHMESPNPQNIDIIRSLLEAAEIH